MFITQSSRIILYDHDNKYRYGDFVSWNSKLVSTGNSFCLFLPFSEKKRTQYCRQISDGDREGA